MPRSRTDLEGCCSEPIPPAWESSEASRCLPHVPTFGDVLPSTRPPGLSHPTLGLTVTPVTQENPTRAWIVCLNTQQKLLSSPPPRQPPPAPARKIRASSLTRGGQPPPPRPVITPGSRANLGSRGPRAVEEWLGCYFVMSSVEAVSCDSRGGATPRPRFLESSPQPACSLLGLEDAAFAQREGLAFRSNRMPSCALKTQRLPNMKQAARAWLGSRKKGGGASYRGRQVLIQKVQQPSLRQRWKGDEMLIRAKGWTAGGNRPDAETVPPGQHPGLGG